MANPDAYFATIPSANKFVKKLYDQAGIRDARTRTTLHQPQPAKPAIPAIPAVSRKEYFQRLTTPSMWRENMRRENMRLEEKPFWERSTTPLPGNAPPTVKKVDPGMALGTGIRRVATNTGKLSGLSSRINPDQEILAAIKLRSKTRYLDKLKCTQLQFDYLERREAIIRFLGLDKAYDGTATREKLQWIFRHPLYCLLRIIERNWMLIFSVWGELHESSSQ